LWGRISTGSISHQETHTQERARGCLHPCPSIIISNLSSEVLPIHDRALLQKVTMPRAVHV
jgi:hypothetical protein